jgi:hypothetical protein
MNDNDFAPDERAANGAAWLDEHGPADWRLRVDPDLLDLSHPRRCVLGQVYGDFFDAPSEANFSVNEDGWSISVSAERGFDAHEYDELEELTRAWRRLLAKRAAA